MELNLGNNVSNLTDPWKLSLFSAEVGGEPSLSAAPNFDLEFANSDNPYASEASIEQELKLPDLANFQYGVLEDIPLPDESVVTTEDEKSEGRAEEIEDIWRLIVDEGLIAGEAKFLTWETFLEPKREEEACSAYLSEAGPGVFDVALRIQEKGEKLPEEIPVIRSDVFLKSVFALGLGRSSALFQYDAKTKEFEQTISDGTMSGYSIMACQSLISKTMDCGRIIRHLRDFADKTYSSGKAFPARVALANSITSILDALELHLTATSGHLCSLLQIQQAFERPHRLCSEVYDMARSVRSARSNEELGSWLFQRCQNCDQEPNWLRTMMLQILARVSRPWLEVAEQWAGLMDDTGSPFDKEKDTGIFVAREESSHRHYEEGGGKQEELQHIFRPERLPSFISLEDGQMIFDIGRDIRILRAHRPEHPLVQGGHAQKHDMALRWQFGWEDADRVTVKAKAYENALAIAVREFEAVNTSPAETHFTDIPESGSLPEPTGPFAFEGTDLFKKTTHASYQLPDELFDIITANLTLDMALPGSDPVDFSPPTAITPLLSFNPLLAAQQRLVNAVVIRMFFRTHKLRLHFDIQRSYHLLGDGVFVSRLTTALFDPNQTSTERHHGVMRSGTGMGLRLGNRGNWPPASSELRLALMGILSESFHASFQKQARKGDDLPGSLSFAIRQLSEDEAAKIMDADSLHALDFLRLQYAPPAPLGAVLTPSSLERYDNIFKFLLRLARLLFVVSRLPRDLSSPKACLYRLQAEHFVSTCCQYFFDSGVSETWTVFMEYLNSIEKRLAEEDEAGELGTRVVEGIEDMRKQHDLCLDRIAFALLLRNRQQKVMAVLEDIFSNILEFSKLCHSSSTAVVDINKIVDLQSAFQDKVKLFLDVCKGLVEKRGYGKPVGERRGVFRTKVTSGEENTLERLVAALDYNTFYEGQDDGMTRTHFTGHGDVLNDV